MTITPDQADQWRQGATDGPWSIDPDYGTVEPGVISGEGCRFEASDEDLALIAAAPDLAQTIAMMNTEYAVQAKEGGLTQLYYGRDIVWTDTELTARQVAHEIGGTVVRRFVTDPEVAS